MAKWDPTRESDKENSQDDSCLSGLKGSWSRLQDEVDKALVLLENSLGFDRSIAATGEGGREGGEKEGKEGRMDKTPVLSKKTK